MRNSMLTVSQLNRYIKAQFEENKLFSHLLIQGEISNLTDHYSSGHLYFSLKDASASVKAVMFRSYAQKLRFRPKNGQTVIVSCSVSVYERDGVYQLYVYDMQPDGAGALALAFEQLKEKLSQEGLFDPAHKRPIPRMPLRIGVVTSQTGAAFQDILHVLGRRWPIATVVLAPVLVQGENAAPQMVEALERLNRTKACEVILLGRGGGSAEDLWAFNSERLAHAIYDSEIPVISAVGHEIDYTIADFVADLRAPTPSAAAELAAPDLQDLRYTLAAQEDRLLERMETRLAALQDRLNAYQNHPALQSPRGILMQHQKHLDQCRERLQREMERKLALLSSRMAVRERMDREMEHRVSRCADRLAGQAKLLDSLSPLRVLSRGYSILLRGGKPVTSAKQAPAGSQLDARLADGRLRVRVLETREE